MPASLVLADGLTQCLWPIVPIIELHIHMIHLESQHRAKRGCIAGKPSISVIDIIAESDRRSNRRITGFIGGFGYVPRLFPEAVFAPLPIDALLAEFEIDDGANGGL